MDRDRRQQIREAIARADHAVLLGLLRHEVWPEDSLQLIGEGLLGVLASHHEARVPARLCAAALRERDWEGDELLADTIGTQLGENAPLPLRPVPVDLDQLAAALHASEWDSAGRLNLATGEVWPPFNADFTDIDDEDEPEDENGWLEIRGQGSRPGYRDMEAFVAWRITDERTAERLTATLHRPRPFRRFKDTLAEWPDLLDAWYAFSEERELGRARAWLADEGYTRELR